MDRRLGLIAIAALAACGGGSRKGPKVVPRQVEVLLDAQLASTRGLGDLGADFDVSPGKLVVVSDASHLYAIGWGGVEPMGELPGVDSLAFTPDGLMLAIQGDQLEYVDADGALQPLASLPHTGMALATGPADGVYLFDRAPTGDGVHALYQLMPGRQIAKLLETPQPIDCVAQAGQRLLFVSGGVVFDATPGEEMRMVARLAESTITSVAGDDERVYVSDGAAVFALADEGPVLVTGTAGGSLRLRDGALLVLDPAHRSLVRLAPLKR